MTEEKRRLLLLGIVVLLVAANLLRFSGSEGSAIFFEGGDFDELTPELQRTVEEIEGLPALNFSLKKSAKDDQQTRRNPFIFGVDRVKEEEQRQRMVELEQTRRQMEEARAAQVVAAEQAEPEVVQAKFDGTILGLLVNAKTGEIQVSLRYQDEYHVLKPGDTLAQTYKLLSADEEHVRMLALASSQEIDIPLESH